MKLNAAVGPHLLRETLQIFVLGQARLVFNQVVQGLVEQTRSDPMNISTFLLWTAKRTLSQSGPSSDFKCLTILPACGKNFIFITWTGTPWRFSLAGSNSSRGRKPRIQLSAGRCRRRSAANDLTSWRSKSDMPLQCRVHQCLVQDRPSLLPQQP